MKVEEIQVLMDEAEQEAIEEVREEDATLTLGAIGSPYKVGPIDVTIAIGNIVLLNEIDSPFLSESEEGEELDPTECIKSLYVLGLGKDALKPVMAIKQRIQALMMLKPMVEKNPDLFESLMDRTEKIAEAHADFELAAMDWYNENFVGWDFQEVMTQVIASFNDFMKAAGDLPQSGEPEKKKRRLF
jgi:hypothetical protein